MSLLIEGISSDQGSTTTTRMQPILPTNKRLKPIGLVLFLIFLLENRKRTP